MLPLQRETGFVRISRREQFYAVIRGLLVYLDGKKVGTIAFGDRFELALPPAEYLIQVKMDWCSSQPFVFQLHAGQILHLEARLNGGSIGAIVNTFFNWNNLFLLTPITDKSKVKNVEPY